MKLAGVTLLSGSLTVVRMACGFVVAKMISLAGGPSGLALFGQTQSLLNGLGGLISAPVSTGLIRYTAQSKSGTFDDAAPWWGASLRMMLVLLALIVPLTCVLALPVSRALFPDSSYWWVIVLIAAALPWYGCSILVSSVLNGLGRFPMFVGLGLASLVGATVVSCILILGFGMMGGLVGAVLFPVIGGVAALALASKQPWFKRSYWLGHFSSSQVQGQGRYVAMSFASTTVAHLSIILVRDILSRQVSWEAAGYWQAVFRMSEIYLGVLTTGLSTYYLPRLAALTSPDEMKREVWATVRFVLPVVAVLACGVYFFRDLAIKLLFSEEFRPARDLFALQLVGDVIKIVSWVCAMPMLARGAMAWFVSSEFASGALLVLLTRVFSMKWGVQAAPLAYALTYSCYLVFTLVALPRVARMTS